MNQKARAELFKALHQRGNPLVLYNIWDFGSARAVADAGAKALATGSWSVAAAQGYDDGEKIPKEELFNLSVRISSRIDLPLSVDFEGAYAKDPEDIAVNVGKLIEAGAIGLNFEDQVVGGVGLYSLDAQIRRIEAVRQAGLDADIPVFINARTDYFLKETDLAKQPALLSEVIERGLAFASAGADGFFVPGLADIDMIAKICDAVPLPVNILMRAGVPDTSSLASAGVARISCGPGPYRQAMADLATKVRALQTP